MRYAAVVLLLTSPLLIAYATAAPVPKDNPKPNPAEKLAGVWKLVSTPDKLPAETDVTVEFTATGTLVLRVKVGREVNSTAKGTFKADGDKLHYVLDGNSGERKETLHIHTLTADTLIVIDPDKKREEFRRVPTKK